MDNAYFKQRTSKLLNKTLPELLLDWSETQADKEAVVVYSKNHVSRDSITYGGLVTRARSVGTNLIFGGLRPGARVGLLGPNSLEWVLCYYGAMFAGALVLKLKVEMLNNPSECSELLESHKVEVVFHSNKLGAEAEGKLAEIRRITGSSVEYQEMSDFCTRAEVSECNGELDKRLAGMKPDDPALVYFTSGSTGAPKAVVHTHNTTSESGRLGFSQITTKHDIFWADRSFSWTGCLLDFMMATLGLTTIYSQPSFKPEIEELMTLFEKEKVTCCIMIPYVLTELLGYGRHHDISKVRELNWVITGGEKITTEFWEEVKGKVPGLFMIYGSTEIFPICSTISLGIETSRASIVSENIEIQIMKDEDGVAKRGEQGEIWLRSPHLTPGYLDRSEETARAIDADGWFKTGDVGVISPENLLKVIGRKKYFISRGGLKIHPSFVEKQLESDERVKSICVIGIPDPKLFEKICACVVLKEANSLTSDDIMNLFKVKCSLTTEGRGLLPDHVLIFQNLPVNDNGKMDREVLKVQAQLRLA